MQGADPYAPSFTIDEDTENDQPSFGRQAALLGLQGLSAVGHSAPYALTGLGSYYQAKHGLDALQKDIRGPWGRYLMPAIAGARSLSAQIEGNEDMPMGGLGKASAAAALSYVDNRWLGGGLGPVTAQVQGYGKPGYRWWKAQQDYDPEGDRSMRSWGLSDDPFGTRWAAESLTGKVLDMKDKADNYYRKHPEILNTYNLEGM